MWEHKHEVFEDDSLRSDAETSRDDSNSSEPGGSEISMKEEGNTRASLETREHDLTDYRNGKTENDKEQSERNNGQELRSELKTEKKEVSSSERELTESGSESREGQTTPAKQATKELGSVQHNNTTTNTKQTESARLNADKAREVSNTAREEKQTARIDETRDSKETSRLSNNQTRDESSRAKDISARDGKISARDGKISAREAERVEDTIDSVNNNEMVKGGTTQGGQDDKNNMKYSGDDLAFVNLLDDIVDDQSLFEGQLDRLEKQVESKYDVMTNKYWLYIAANGTLLTCTTARKLNTSLNVTTKCKTTTYNERINIIFSHIGGFHSSLIHRETLVCLGPLVRSPDSDFFNLRKNA
jgi:hypothetical protein